LEEEGITVRARRTLNDPLIAEVRAAEVRAAEVRAAEVRAAEVRAAEVRAAEVRAAEVRAAEVRAAEVRAAEVRAAEVRAAEVRAAEVRAAFDGPLDRKAKLDAGQFTFSASDLRSKLDRARETIQNIEFEKRGHLVSPDLMERVVHGMHNSVKRNVYQMYKYFWRTKTRAESAGYRKMELGLAV